MPATAPAWESRPARASYPDVAQLAVPQDARDFSCVRSFPRPRPPSSVPCRGGCPAEPTHPAPAQPHHLSEEPIQKVVFPIMSAILYGLGKLCRQHSLGPELCLISKLPDPECNQHAGRHRLLLHDDG